MTEQTKDRAVIWLVRLSVAAGVVWTAVSEWQLARIIGAPSWVAPSLPLAIDAYVIAAVRSGNRRDLAGALAIMSCAQIAARLLDAGQVQVSVALVAFVSVLVPLTIWRVHALAGNHEVPAQPEPVPVQVPRAVPPQVQVPKPQQVPAAPPNPKPVPAPSVSNPAPAANQQPVNLNRAKPKTPKPKQPTAPAGQATPSVSKQVEQILSLIEEHGYDTVKLGFVQEQTGMSKTTAYNRLVEARAVWSEQHDQ